MIRLRFFPRIKFGGKNDSLTYFPRYFSGSLSNAFLHPGVQK